MMMQSHGVTPRSILENEGGYSGELAGVALFAGEVR
jgi:hypothetical protein